MKNFTPHESLQREKTKLEVTQEKEAEIKLEYDSTIIPHENHTLWEIDIKTQEISKAEYEVGDYMYNPKWTKKTKLNKNLKIITNEGKVYISALTKETALKKFRKGVNGTKIDTNKNYLNL